MALKEVKLTPKLNNRVELDRTNRIIELSETVSGVPYVELSNITINDWYKNSHIKTLSGIYTGGRPTRIKVRDHYPHSIGTDWCRLSNLLVAESNTTRVNVAKTQEFIPIMGEDNYTCFKDTAFWGAINTLITVGDIEVANSMRYDTIEPYAPTEGSANYYGDRMSAVGVPMPTTPSPWYYGTIDYDEQTWEVEITLNPFTMFEGTAYQQTHNYWKPYHITSYPVGLNYDPRLHAIEVDITSSYDGQTIHGKRIYYIWHIPQCWALASKAPKIELTTGAYSGPFGLRNCDAITSGYDTGYTASGGTGKIELQGNDINYDNILLQLYPVVHYYDEGLYNPHSMCIDDDGNYYIMHRRTAYSTICKYDSDRNFVKEIATTSIVGTSKIIYYNGYIYLGYYYIQKFDLNGVLISSFGGYGSGDGKFNQYPKITAYDDKFYCVIASKLQVFDINGTYITKLLPPAGFYLYDITVDESGNLYVRCYQSSDTSNSYIIVCDKDLNYLNFWATMYPYSGIFYKNNYLYVQNNNRIEKQDPTNGNVISGYDISCTGYSIVDNEGNIYIYESDAVNVLNNEYASIYKIGKSEIKYTKRNGLGVGLTELSQLKKAYAVISPNNFDPTNPSTYTAMTEYTGTDFNNITMEDGLLKLKNLYPDDDHYIYVIVNYSPEGSLNTQYNYWSWDTGIYCPSGTVGNKRHYGWFTRYPSCSEIPAGSITQYCNQAYSFDEYMTDDRSIEVSLDNFDSGSDLNTVTTLYEWFYWGRVHIYSNGSDGGRTKFWIAYTDDGVKTNYNNVNDAVNILSMGLPVQIYYNNQDYYLYDGINNNYGWGLGGINLINRILKDGTYLTTGFDTACNIERTSS